LILNCFYRFTPARPAPPRPPVPWGLGKHPKKTPGKNRFPAPLWPPGQAPPPAPGFPFFFFFFFFFGFWRRPTTPPPPDKGFLCFGPKVSPSPRKKKALAPGRRPPKAGWCWPPGGGPPLEKMFVFYSPPAPIPLPPPNPIVFETKTGAPHQKLKSAGPRPPPPPGPPRPLFPRPGLNGKKNSPKNRAPTIGVWGVSSPARGVFFGGDRGPGARECAPVPPAPPQHPPAPVKKKAPLKAPGEKTKIFRPVRAPPPPPGGPPATPH